MFNIEMAGYAALPGLLALVIAVLIVPGIHRSIGSLPRIFPKKLLYASALIIACLFVFLLLFLEPSLSSFAFLAGVFSTLLYLLFSLAVFKYADAFSSEGGIYRAGLSIGLGAPGLVLLAVGTFFIIFNWKDVPVINAYAFGAACILLVISLNGVTGREEDPALRPAVDATDFYISSLCVLVAAAAIGAATTEYQRVWIGMPVLFVMAALTASIVGAVVMRASIHGRSWLLNTLVCLSTLVGMVFQYILLRELTRKMPAGAIAGLGMLDRMGPFWASMSGVMTGVLLIILARYTATPSGQDHKNLAFAFSLYFVAVGLWMSYLFADFYGIAFAGIGMLGALSLPAGRQIVGSIKGDEGRGGGFLHGMSVFSTLAVVAAYLMWAREAADLEDGLTEISVFAGLILGAGMIYIMSSLAKKLSEQSLKDSASPSPFRSLFLSGIVVLVIPLLVGFVAGAETLAGLLLGMALPGVYEIFKLDRQDEGKEARCLNGLMRLAALVSLLAAPLMLLI